MPVACTPSMVVSLRWPATCCRYSEISDYNYASPGFQPGAGHFSQVVWAATSQVGCGMKTCTTNSPFGASFPTWTLVVW